MKFVFFFCVCVFSSDILLPCYILLCRKISMVGGLLDGARNGVSGDLFINMDYSDFPMESLEGDELDGGHQDAKVQSLGPFS